MITPIKNLFIAAITLTWTSSALSASAGNSVLIFSNNFTTSTPGTYTTGQTINSGNLTAQLKEVVPYANVFATIVNPGRSFTDGPALDLTNNGSGGTSSLLANRLGDGNTAWNQLSSGTTGNNLLTASFSFNKLLSTGGFRFFIASGDDETGAASQVGVLAMQPSGLIQGSGGTGTTDPGYTVTIGTSYNVIVTVDLSSTTQHTYSYVIYNMATNAVVYASGALTTRAPTAVPDRIVLDWGIVGASSTSPNPFIEIGAVEISAGNSSIVFNNNFSTSTTGTYTNGQTINSGNLTAQLREVVPNANVFATIINPGLSFTDGPALDFTNNGSGGTSSLLANRLGDGNTAWNQLSSGATGNNLLTASFSFNKLLSTGGFRYYIASGDDETGAASQVGVLQIQPNGLIQGSGGTGPTDPGYTLTIGTPYEAIVTIDLSNPTQHTFSYRLVNLATNLVVYNSVTLTTRAPTAVPDRLVLDWGIVGASSTSPNPFIEVGDATITTSPIPLPNSRSGTLWRIGLNNGSNAEFTGPGSMPTTYTIGSGWATQTTWPEWPSTPPANTPWTTTINYTLASVPPNGVMFTFKSVNATMEVPELAVYSNFAPCGIIQIGGALSPGWGPTDTYVRTFTRPYQVYIPPQFLVAGSNKLQISALGSPYKRSTTIYLGFTIDYMELDTQTVLPSEPINGKITYTGISDGGFNINPSTVAIDQAEAEWMGVAYCGNPERACFWNDSAGLQAPADRLSYLQELKALNMRVILDGWNCKNTTDSEIVNGQLPADGSATYISGLFSSYGSLFQFYEITNEPCESFTNASHQYCVAVANYVHGIKPSNVLLTSPGYAYGGGYGNPVNWDSGANDANRTALDNLCDAYDGHAFGNSYGYDNGNLAETIDAHGIFVGGNPQITNGWAKPFVSTECGSANTAEDFSQGVTSTTELYSSALDRDLRAHIAFADYFCAADMFNNGTTYDYINGTQTDTTTWVANPANSAAGDMDSRPKTLRRLALAYGTHGAPLKYTWQTAPTSLPVAPYGPVYFRAVDTSTLPPLPGSGATANMILLSFVNFDLLNSNTIAVNVTMPAAKSYTGVYYTSATSYTSARVPVTGLVANPVLPLTVTLGPGESVEYILNR